MLKTMYPPIYRGFIHNGCIVVFSSVTTVCNVTSVIHSDMPQIKITDGLPCLWEVVIGSIGDFKWVNPHLKKKPVYTH